MLSYWLLFSFIDEKLSLCVPLFGLETAQEAKHFGFPPLEGAVYPGNAARSSSAQHSEERLIQGQGSLSSYVGPFEQNPTPILLPSLINGPIQCYCTCKYPQMVPSLDVAIRLHLVNNRTRAEEAPLSRTITKKNDVNKVAASDLGI